ncbi:DUF1542 domain-containing protein [Staphylococcus pasteuri]|uniref:DUF1542 domain-containing protein n=1 Tax=Staphylococcus TaxID=1279 RepID=UPI0012F1C028|nr:hypothetical protein STAPHY8AQ_20916 [Staphylococcus sp. 8AQ]
MNQLQQTINDNEASTKNSGNYINAEAQLKRDFDQAITNAQDAVDKANGLNLPKEQIQQLIDAISTTKDALNGDQRLSDAKTKALETLDQLTNINNAQKQLATLQIDNADTLNKVTRAINKATAVDQAMNALKQYVQNNELPIKSSSNFINADDDLKAQFNKAISNAQNVLNKDSGNALTNTEVGALKQAIIDAENALNGDLKVSNAKSKADKFIDSLDQLNQPQKVAAHEAIKKANDLDTINDIINDQIELNDAMAELRDLVENTIPNSENSIDFQNADQSAKDNLNEVKSNAQQMLDGNNNNDTDVNDVRGMIESIKEAINQLNGEERLQEAKNDAIQEVNKALADKLKEINASNATEQDKTDAINKAKELANQIINDINNSTSNDQVNKVQQSGNKAIDEIHANEIPKAKIDAKNDIEQKINDLITKITNNPDLTDTEKQQLINQLNQLKQQSNNDIDNATTKEDIDRIKQKLEDAVNNISNYVKAKVDAKNEIKDAAAAKIKEIDNNPDLTPEQKAAAKVEVNRLKEQALKDIDNATDLNGIDEAKSNAQDTINQFDPNQFTIDQAKDKAKQAIEDAANNKLKDIDNNPDLTPEQKAAAKDEVNRLKEQALKDIDNAKDLNGIDEAKSKAQDTINQFDPNQFTIDQAKDKAKQAIEDAANNKLKEIDNNPDLTPEQKTAAKDEVNRLKEQALKDIDNAKDLNGIDEAKSQAQDTINQFDPNQFTIDQAKDKAKQAIEEAANNKLKEIDNNPDLTPEQKAAAKDEVNRLKDQALKDIDNAKDINGIDETKSKAQDTINQFDPNQFTIDQAKDKAKQAIEDAANNKLKEIDNNPDLTPEQKAAAKDEVNRLKDQALKDIDNSKSLEDITKQQHKFISQIISVNPIKDLVKRKDDAIKNINKISTQKANDIRNSRFGTASQKQDALNRINSIVNDTIRRIKNAHTPQEVDDALRDGINRILAVQINTNIGRNRNQFNNTLNRPFDLTRVVRANQTNATTIFGNGTKEKLNGSIPSDKSKQNKDKNNNHQNTHSVTDSIANVLKKTLGFVGISGLLASFWFVMAKRRRKEEEDEMLNHKDTIKDEKKTFIE